MMGYMKRVMEEDHDVYDVVGARINAELAGWHRCGLGMAQPSYPWPDVQHELGGARVYHVTKKYWGSTVTDYLRQMVGADLVFDVPDELVKANAELHIPQEAAV
jgi:hypothetical protein